MNTTTPTRNRQAGSSLILALILTTVAATAAATVYFYAASQAQMGRKANNLMQARAIAETGLNMAYSQLRANIALANSNAWPWTTFSNGQYMVTATTVGSNLITLVSVGQYNGVQSQTCIDLKYYPSTSGSSGGGSGGSGSLYGPYTFTNVMYVGGTCTWSGSGTFNGGCAYINGALNLSGSGSWGKSTGTLTIAITQPIAYSGSANITATTLMTPSITLSGSGNITANTVVLATTTSYSTPGSGRISGTIVAGTVPAATLPSINLTPFYTVAAANGMVQTNANGVAAVHNPVGGVQYVVGKINFSDSTAYTGCYIATAGINLSQSGNISPYTNGWPTLYTQSGSLSMGGSGTTYGFCYSGGTASLSGSGPLSGGPLIVGSTLSMSGSGGISLCIPATGFVITPPVVNAQQTSNTVQRLVVTGWQ